MERTLLRIEIVVDPRIWDTMMHETKLLALAILVAYLTACAGSEPNTRTREPTASEIAKLIGCSSHEVALCIEVNCELEEWHCADSDDVRDMFRAGDFNR